MYIFGSFRFGATGVISGPDGPEGPGSICDSVGCILGSSQLRRYRHFSYTSVLEHALHSHAGTRTFAHRIETTVAARERSPGPFYYREWDAQLTRRNRFL